MTVTTKNVHLGSGKPIGQFALHAMLQLSIPPPHTHSFIVNSARRTVETDTYTAEYYRPQYETDGSLIGNLRFALKHETIDLGVIYAALAAIGESALTEWIRGEPTSVFTRRAWFYYETFTGKILDIENARTGNYVDALDASRHFVSEKINSPRHRVRDNFLGSRDLCPIVRKTHKLTTMIAMSIAEEARSLSSSYPPEMIARAVNYLYTKETRSSFAIEGETPSRNREERFLNALHSAPAFDYNRKDDLIRLQGQIVDPRYAAADWREIQNFVGETTRNFGEHVHFVCPRPQDVSGLMAGWMALTDRLIASSLDAVVAAATTSFAFVFIHPFEDGNGRIHRFLIHYMLTKLGFTPPGLIFPVSAAILREMHLYNKALEAFSKPILSSIDWSFDQQNQLLVRNDTADLYRFFDATTQVEYLYERIVETVRVDFKEELEFLNVFDSALIGVKRIIDMPDRQAIIITRYCLQNKGFFSNNKRKQFPEITEDEARRIEQAVQNAIHSAAQV